jgi:AcrR family transcriptional regulator
LDGASKQAIETRIGGRLVSTRTVPASLAGKLTAAAAGFDSAADVRMDDIAAASGIPRATLYYYFAGKDDVLAFLLRSMLDDLRRSVGTALAVGGDTRARLESVVRALLAQLAASRAASQLLLTNLGRAGRLGDIASGIEAGFHAPVRRVLGEGIATGDVRDIDVEVAATAIFASVAVVGLQSLFVTGSLDVDATADRLLAVFWSGMAVPRVGGPGTAR